MARLSLEEFSRMLEEAVERIPPRYCQDLTGGFNIQEKAVQDGEYYVLGEYIEDDQLGCFIVFYYGSFAGLLEEEAEEVWKEEIEDTVLHEMQHHLESLAGRDDLARQELEELARALRQ